MLYHKIINALAAKRLDLGMSDVYIARHAGLSQPTVNRILSGQHKSARMDHIIAIAAVLGMECGISDIADANRMRQDRAVKSAWKLAEATQATMALEGQGLGRKEREDLMARERLRLLAGPNSKLWTDE